jgi:hypothetical protein
MNVVWQKFVPAPMNSLILVIMASFLLQWIFLGRPLRILYDDPYL